MFSSLYIKIGMSVCLLDQHFVLHVPTPPMWETSISHAANALWWITISLVQGLVIVWRLKGNIIKTALCWIVTQCSAAHLYEKFLQVKQIGFVTLGPVHSV